MFQAGQGSLVTAAHRVRLATPADRALLGCQGSTAGRVRPAQLEETVLQEQQVINVITFTLAPALPGVRTIRPPSLMCQRNDSSPSSGRVAAAQA